MRSPVPLPAAPLMILALAALAGCELGIPAGSEPQREFNFTDMGDQPKLKPQREDLFGIRPNGMVAPPVGAVAIGEHPYRFTQAQVEAAAVAMESPLPYSLETRRRGEFVYTNVCIACHGPTGAGDGEVARLFPRPPDLMRSRARFYSNGRIFHVPMRGQGAMPSHANLVTPDDLWAVVQFIRHLQNTQPVAPPDPKDPLPQIPPKPRTP